MTFGKKFAELHGEDKLIELNYAQIEAAVLAHLSALKVIKYDPYDVFTADLSDVVGKKSSDTVKVRIKIRKEVKAVEEGQELRKRNGLRKQAGTSRA